MACSQHVKQLEQAEAVSEQEQSLVPWELIQFIDHNLELTNLSGDNNVNCAFGERRAQKFQRFRQDSSDQGDKRFNLSCAEIRSARVPPVKKASHLHRFSSEPETAADFTIASKSPRTTFMVLPSVASSRYHKWSGINRIHQRCNFEAECEGA